MISEEKYQMHLTEIARMEKAYPSLVYIDNKYPGEIDAERLESEALSNGIELENLIDYYLLKHQLVLHDFEHSFDNDKMKYGAEVIRTHKILGHLERGLVIPVDNPLDRR